MDTNKLELCLITIIKLRRFTPTGAVTASQFTIEGVVDINTLFRSSNSIKESAHGLNRATASLKVARAVRLELQH